MLCIRGNSGSIPAYMLKRLSILLLLLVPAFEAVGESWEISAAEWSRPRHGDWLVRQPALRAAIEKLQQAPSSRLQLRYPGGDEGVLWAEELQSWLVALGLESERIERVPGSGAPDRIQLQLVE